MGPPRKLTEGVIEALGQYLSAGANLDEAAAAVGVADRTIYRWLEVGKAAETDDDGEAVNEDEKLYVSLVQTAARARDVFKAKALAELRTAQIPTKDGGLMPDTASLKWILERRFSDEFSQRIEIVAREQAARHLLAHLRERLPADVFALVVAALSDEPAQESEHTEH